MLPDSKTFWNPEILRADTHDRVQFRRALAIRPTLQHPGCEPFPADRTHSHHASASVL